MVLVRDIQDLNFVWSQQNGDGAGLASIPPAELFRIADGFSITAVIPLGNGARPIFNPSTTQAERRGIVESLAWFDRVDARAKVSLQ
jgi:hypothetical protein